MRIQIASDLHLEYWRGAMLDERAFRPADTGLYVADSILCVEATRAGVSECGLSIMRAARQAMAIGSRR